MANYCEGYPCCGHTPSDPCERQPYDEPGYFSRNEHALCDHEAGVCDVWQDEPEIDPDDCEHPDKTYSDDLTVECDLCYADLGTWDPKDWPEFEYAAQPTAARRWP